MDWNANLNNWVSINFTSFIWRLRWKKGARFFTQKWTLSKTLWPGQEQLHSAASPLHQDRETYHKGQYSNPRRCWSVAPPRQSLLAQRQCRDRPVDSQWCPRGPRPTWGQNQWTWRSISIKNRHQLASSQPVGALSPRSTLNKLLC